MTWSDSIRDAGVCFMGDSFLSRRAWRLDAGSELAGCGATFELRNLLAREIEAPRNIQRRREPASLNPAPAGGGNDAEIGAETAHRDEFRLWSIRGRTRCRVIRCRALVAHAPTKATHRAATPRELC